MATALEGLRVLELGSGAAAGIAGMVLAENGAEVVKIESPQGDRDRGRPGFAVWHRGKKSAVLDLADAGDRDRFLELARVADGVIEALRPATSARLGVDFETLRKLNGQLVYAAITGFGETGPWRDLPGHEQIVAAKSGRMTTYDGVRPGPVFTPVPIASYGAGMLAAVGLMAGIWARPRLGRGQRVHTSLLHALSVYDMTSGHGNRTNMPPEPGKVYGIMRVPFMTAPTKDGRFIQMCSRQTHHYRRWLAELGLEALLDDPELANAPDLWPSEERLAEVIEAIRHGMEQRTAEEWMDVFWAKDIGGDPFLAPREFLDHPQCTQNERRQEVLDPDLGPTVQIGPLGMYSETPSIVGPPAPCLGEHTDDVMANWLSATSPKGHADQDSHTGKLPLADVTILDVGYFYACPFAATLLAEAGARVIKVEPPTGDPGRRNWTTDYVKSLVGKESIVLDLKTPEGLDILYRLVDKADVFLHNFRPGTPERLGIDAEAVMARNPALLYVYASCFGSRGPWAHKAGFHSSPNAIAGAGVVESGDQNPPRNRTYGDPTAALATAAAIMTGVLACRRTGRGQKLETTMLTATAYAVAEWGIQHSGLPAPVVDSGQFGYHAYQRLYETANGWLVLDVHRDREHQALGEVLGIELPELPSSELETQLAEVFSSDSAEAWESRLLAAGVPAAQADRGDFLHNMLNEIHMRKSGVAVEAEQDGLGSYWRAAPTMQFSSSPTPLAPTLPLGWATMGILGELGIDHEEITRLHDAGVTKPIGHGLPT
ncbi:CaiB/BaiF CoA transferase family protein [Candidatus Poriferisocius sp.]|uniref:CaiB/BaiF CoA transferase family protein n=1 Tax=Candidatus Poriferisocius sp. TaxID=3101276 RepID=UPI003B01569F